MRRATACLLLLLLTPALAQTDWTPPLPAGAQVLNTPDEVVQTLGAASQELMLAAPLLRSKEVADAVRVALVERGVPVYILAPVEGVEDPASYLMSLALAGAAVSLAPVDDAFVIVDRTILLLGPLLSGETTLPGQTPAQTYYFDDPNQAAPFVESFYQSFSGAAVYDPETFVNDRKDTYLDSQATETEE